MAAPDLGMVDATPGALDVLQLAEPFELFNRHASGDWGEVSARDAAANERAIREGARIVSCYRLDGHLRVYVVTEADRSATTIMLPEEYQRSLEPPEPPLPDLPQ